MESSNKYHYQVRIILMGMVWIFIALKPSIIYSQSTERDVFIKGLRKLHKEELQGKQIKFDSSIVCFNLNGERITLESLMPFLEGEKHSADIYVDSNGKAKALVLRLASQDDLNFSRPVSTPQSTLVNNPTPPFTVTDIDGNVYSSDKLKGKVVVLNFWFTKCPPCKMEIPHLNEIVGKYKDKEIVFIAISFNDSMEQINEFLKTTQYDYKMVPQNRTIIEKFGIRSYPTNIVIDKNGNITYFKIGYNELVPKQIETEIESVL